MRLTISRGQILILLLAIIQDGKRYSNPLNYTRLQKVQYLLNESTDLYEIAYWHADACLTLLYNAIEEDLRGMKE